jgi:hypothetical protein
MQPLRFMPVLRDEEVHRIRKRLEERRKSQVEIHSPETTETGSRRAIQEIDLEDSVSVSAVRPSSRSGSGSGSNSVSVSSSSLSVSNSGSNSGLGSGSGSGPSPSTTAAAADSVVDADGVVSFRVYRLADLDARRASLASAPVAVVPRATNLERISRAAFDSMNVAVAWTKGDRSSGFIQTVRPSLTTLIASMRLLDGRNIARRAAMVITSIMFLVGALLLLAEVTDDLRPVQARASTTITNGVASANPPTSTPTPTPTTTTPTTPPTTKTEARAPAAQPVIDVDDSPTSPPPVSKKKSKKTAKRAEVEIFLP